MPPPREPIAGHGQPGLFHPAGECGGSAARSRESPGLHARRGGRDGGVRRGETRRGRAPGSARVRGARRPRAAELGDRRAAGAPRRATLRHLPLPGPGARRWRLHGAAAGGRRNPPGLPAGRRGCARRERGAGASDRRAGTDRERARPIGATGCAGPGPTPRRPPPFCSRAAQRKQNVGGTCWPKGGRAGPRSPTTYSPPTSTA